MITAFTLLAMLVIAFLCWRIYDQDKTIRQLTDKLMARSFKDYVVGVRAREDPPPDITSRKPMSWYDDPNILDGDSS
ncbi:hypothetical protein ACL02P_15370 [Paenibacillus sp. MB22_1]|uniref:hypothetical protein n=1 Tax=Paenibacillus sp. MB22_1 TaxID=3383121 RepID=UPI0039A0C7CC